MDERRKIEDPPTIADVARMIVGDGSAPDWLVRGLEYLSCMVVGIELADDMALEKRMLKAARYLEEWLPMFEWIEQRREERFGFEAAEWIDELSTALYQAIEYLEEETASLGKHPDRRKLMCALVMSRAHELIHGKRSAALGDACELYWQACGNEHRGEYGHPENWRRNLKAVTDEPDSWPLDLLDDFRSGRRT
jgi:hypothetical protein